MFWSLHVVVKPSPNNTRRHPQIIRLEPQVSTVCAILEWFIADHEILTWLWRVHHSGIGWITTHLIKSHSSTVEQSDFRVLWRLRTQYFRFAAKICNFRRVTQLLTPIRFNSRTTVLIENCFSTLNQLLRKMRNRSYSDTYHQKLQETFSLSFNNWRQLEYTRRRQWVSNLQLCLSLFVRLYPWSETFHGLLYQSVKWPDGLSAAKTSFPRCFATGSTILCRRATHIRQKTLAASFCKKKSLQITRGTGIHNMQFYNIAWRIVCHTV